MEEVKHEVRRIAVRDFMLLHPSALDKNIVHHFLQQGMKQRTIYEYIKRVREGKDTKKVKLGGKPPCILTPKIREQLVNRFDGEAGVSIKKAAIHFKVSSNVINKWLNEIGIQKKKRKKIPMVTEKQKKKQNVIMNKISRQEFRKENDVVDVVMDDETYIDMNGYETSGSSYYFSSGLLTVDEEKKYRKKTKFPQKLLVWIAISRRGHSRVYFRRQKEGAVNQTVYGSECIKKRLVPFLKKKYPDNNYIFWPDLASSHYASSVKKLMEDENVKVLAKERNPPNVPQLRPIETFWAHFKSRVFANDFKPKSIDDLEKRARKVIPTFKEPYFERLMSSVGQKIRKAANQGVLSVIN